MEDIYFDDQTRQFGFLDDRIEDQKKEKKSQKFNKADRLEAKALRLKSKADYQQNNSLKRIATGALRINPLWWAGGALEKGSDKLAAKLLRGEKTYLGRRNLRAAKAIKLTDNYDEIMRKDRLRRADDLMDRANMIRNRANRK
jgi:hypothetical protein